MGKIALIVHGGAGEDSDWIRDNQEKFKDGINEALDKGYKLLEEGGSAVDAVEAAVVALENNKWFNAGRGSALNAKGQVEMDAAIMDGKSLNSGAVAIVQNVRNPISLAKAVMLNTSYRFLGDFGAIDYAKRINIALEPDSYFITDHQYDEYVKKREEEFVDTRSIALEEIQKKFHGTVGAVAVDQEGNTAAATSSGGTENSKQGRIGDSCIIGSGCFANNERCAVSATGD
jgi:L-asparaginase / beta-aspartyl-peptidase